MQIREIGGQMRADEHRLEAADEIAGIQQMVAAMAARLAQGGADALGGRLVCTRAVAAGQDGGERHDQRRHAGDDDQRRRPAVADQQPLAERHQEKLAR